MIAQQLQTIIYIIKNKKYNVYTHIICGTTIQNIVNFSKSDYDLSYGK